MTKLARIALSGWILLLPAANPARSEETVPISLGDCLRKALENNPDIALARRDDESAHVLLRSAKGIFDPVITASFSQNRSEQPSTSQLAGADILTQQGKSFSLGASELLPWGGTATFSFDGNRTETNSTFSSINPYYSAGFSLAVSQPLLSGFGLAPTRYTIEIQRLGIETADDSLELRVTQVVEQMEGVYWDIRANREDLEVKRRSLQVAEDLLAQNKVRVEVGTLAPIELTQAEAGVAQRQEAIIAAEALVKDTEEKLKGLMGVPSESPLWKKTLIPSDPLPEVPAFRSLEEVLQVAKEERAELKSARRDLESKELGTEFQRNKRRPKLDATASYSSSGVGGDTQIFDPTTGQVIDVVPGGFGDAFHQATGIDFPAWRVGLSFSFPVLNRAGTGSYANARIQQEKAAISLRKLEDEIDREVRTSYRGLETAKRGLEASRVTASAQERKLEAEKKKFENGLSTSFQVLDFEEDVALARSQVTKAETTLRKAVLRLQAAMGMLLDRQGINFTKPAQSDSVHD